MGISLLLHGAALGVVYVAVHKEGDVEVPAAVQGVEVIEILSDPEPVTAPVLKPHPAVKKEVPRPVVAPHPKPVTPVIHPKPLVKLKRVRAASPPAWEDDLTVMEELQDTENNSVNKNAPSPVSASTPPTASLKPVVCAVSGQNNPKPVYPRKALRQRKEGLVVLTLTVTVKGNASGVRVERSSGCALLDNAALKAVRQWRFIPAHMGKVAVSSQVEVPIRFRLSD